MTAPLPLDADVKQIEAAIVAAQKRSRKRLCENPLLLAYRMRGTLDRLLAAAKAAEVDLEAWRTDIDLWLWEDPGPGVYGDVTMVRCTKHGITALRGTQWTTRTNGSAKLTFPEVL